MWSGVCLRKHWNCHQEAKAKAKAIGTNEQRQRNNSNEVMEQIYQTSRTLHEETSEKINEFVSTALDGEADDICLQRLYSVLIRVDREWSFVLHDESKTNTNTKKKKMDSNTLGSTDTLPSKYAIKAIN